MKRYKMVKSITSHLGLVNMVKGTGHQTNVVL